MDSEVDRWDGKATCRIHDIILHVQAAQQAAAADADG